MRMRILGLDPGLANIGYGYIEVFPKSIQLCDFGVITTCSQESVGERLETIYTDLHTLISSFRPDYVAIEKLFFHKMSNTIVVAQARGVILLVLNQLHCPLMEISPSQVKQVITGYGKAKKDEVQRAVQQELQLKQVPKPDDAADALAIALTAGRYFDRILRFR